MFISHILRGWACEVSVLAWSGSGVVKLWQGPSSWLVGSASSHKAERALVSLSLKGYQSYPAPSPDLIPIQSPPKDPTSKHYHLVLLDGLEPGRDYSIWVQSLRGSEASEARGIRARTRECPPHGLPPIGAEPSLRSPGPPWVEGPRPRPVAPSARLHARGGRAAGP